MKSTNRDILKWLHDNLHIDMADIANNLYSDYWITEATLAGIACREYGFLIPRQVNKGWTFEQIIGRAIGDSGHGRSLWQIDDRSYPDFVNSHPLSDYRAYIIKAIECLKEKDQSLRNAGFTPESMGDDAFQMSVICAYNCGQGNVIKSLRAGRDPNVRTYSGDYGKCVMEYRYLYYDMFLGDDSEVPAPTADLITNLQPVLESEPIANKAIPEDDFPNGSITVS